MSMPLFDAKIHPTSALTHIVLRPKIIARLNEVDHWRLAVITAPVGYGKTTLLHQWIKDAAVNTAYLSLDGDDNNQDQFIAYIIKSLNNMNSRIGVGLMKSGELMPSVPPGEILLMLVKQLNSLIHEPYALVLDNYNLINNPLITELISMLMKNTTDKFHLVISSREVPPIPLARPRVQGILLEIQQVDLSFSLEETRDFLAHSIDIKLPTETISALQKRTEGWIAGLQIAAISVRNRPEDKIITALDSFSGIPRDIRDYIQEEVLDKLSEDLYEFLIDTSILTQSNSTLCEAVCRQSNCQHTLERLEKMNLFLIPLDDHGSWFRYHHLFNDILMERLQRGKPGAVLELHHRAAKWFEGQGSIQDAIEHYVKSKEFLHAAELIAANAESLLSNDRHPDLHRWLQDISEKEYIQVPKLYICKALLLYWQGEYLQAKEMLSTAKRYFPTGLPESTKNELMGMAAALLTFISIMQGEFSRAVSLLNTAYSLLPEDNRVWRTSLSIAAGDVYSAEGNNITALDSYRQAIRISLTSGNAYLILSLRLKLARSLWQNGRLSEACILCQELRSTINATGITETAIDGGLLALSGELNYEFNDLKNALIDVKHSYEISRTINHPVLSAWSLSCMVKTYLAIGDINTAAETLRNLENLADSTGLPMGISSLVKSHKAKMAILSNNLTEATEILSPPSQVEKITISYLEEPEYFALAQLLIRQGFLKQSESLLLRLLHSAESGGRIIRKVETCLLLALNYYGQGNRDEAFSFLQQAIAITERDRYMRIFLDQGPQMAGLLYDAMNSAIALHYIGKLLAAFPTYEPVPSNTDGLLIQPLSKQELNILQMIAEGASNKEIGSKLKISVNTVKKHIANIFDKMVVSNRTELTAKARLINLLR